MTHDPNGYTAPSDLALTEIRCAICGRLILMAEAVTHEVIPPDGDTPGVYELRCVNCTDALDLTE